MLAAVFFILMVGFVSTHAQEQSFASQDFDFFVFVELSPGADSRGKNCKNCSVSGTPNWTIHGLWPTRDNCDNPQYCNSSYKFNLKEIESLTPRLNKFWPSMDRRADCNSSQGNLTDNEYFWCHEWETHGTCAASIEQMNTELKFFESVLDLYESKMKYDKYVLGKHGISPTRAHSYTVEQFVDAFETEWEVKPLLRCEWMKDEDHYVLESIRTCLSKDFTHLQCSYCTHEEYNCHDDFYYYPPA